MTKVVWGVFVFGGVLAGCGRVTNDATQDARANDNVADATMLPPRCNPGSPFGAPVAITEVNTAANEEGPYLTPDELTLYFSSTRSGTLGGFDVFMATRASRTAAWGSVVPVTGVNTANSERFPQIAPDELALYAFTGTAGNFEISRAKRSSASGTFGPLTLVEKVNEKDANDGSATITASALWLASDRTGNSELYRASLTNGDFGTPAPVSGTNLNTANNESTPVVTPDELTLFFSSDRSGGVGLVDVWMTTRTTVADGFSVPVNVQSVNSAAGEGPSWISADGCVLYLTRTISTMPLNYDLYYATRGM